MAKRINNTKIGDVFSVQIDDRNKRYFQYIISDLSQLNSDVIRAFKKKYPLEKSPDLSEIVTDEIDFYAHCVTKAGIKRGLWEKIGNIPDVGVTDQILFRDSRDYGNPQIKVSNDWWVWKINEPFNSVGKLEGVTKNAYIGIVFNPKSIFDWLKKGQYGGKYPDFE